MHRLCLLVLLAASAAAVGGRGPAGAAPAAKALFNGRNLEGWDGDPKYWSVKEGAITGQTTAENPLKINTFLIWRGGTVKDFELRAKFRLQGVNSGIQYRSKDLGDWHVGGYQADMDAANMYTGMLYEERGRGILAKPGEKVTIGADGKPVVTGSVGDAAAIRASLKPDGWNEYVIRAEGNHLAHWINGHPSAEALDEDPKGRAMEGILALQLHVGGPMVVQFKDLMLTPLDGGK